MTNDWTHLILKYLYENHNENYTRVGDFLATTFNLDRTSLEEAVKAERMLNSLTKKYIKVNRLARGATREIRDSVAMTGAEANGNTTKLPVNLLNVDFIARLT